MDKYTYMTELVSANLKSGRSEKKQMGLTEAV